MSEPKYVQPLIFYRKSSVAQLTPGYFASPPALFVKLADALPGVSGRPKKGQARYKWDEGIVLALNVDEVMKLALAAQSLRLGRLKEPLSLYHQLGKGEAKKLRLSPPQKEGGAAGFLTVEQGERRIHVPVSHADLFQLEHLLPFVAARMLGWIGEVAERPPKSPDVGLSPPPAPPEEEAPLEPETSYPPYSK